MPIARVVVRAWLVVSCVFVCSLTVGQAQADDAVKVGDVRRLLRGDGREFLFRSPSAENAATVAPLPPSAAELLADGECCSDGDCVCRGGEPTDSTVDGEGPYDVDSYSLGFRFGRLFGGGTVYYPTDAEPPLSAVVMCPGYTATQSSIEDWGPFFASHGIVLLTIDTATTLDLVPQRADQLLDALEELKDEGSSFGSPLYDKLSDDRFGLAGWSMGGGGTWIAASDHPELKSAVTLAGHNLTAGGGIIAAGSRVPTLMLNGAQDLTYLGGLGQSEAAYAAIPSSTPKLLYVMTYEGHFSWGTPRTNGNASGRYVLAWEKVFLEGDERYYKFLLERGPLASTFESNLED
ncbi:MAG: alpha/beta hydrolase [Polyangiales bacterium]